MCKAFHLRFSLHILVNFMEKVPSGKFYRDFDHSSQTHKVTKFPMTQTVSRLKDIINPNDHTSFASCGSNKNLWNFWFTPFFF